MTVDGEMKTDVGNCRDLGLGDEWSVRVSLAVFGVEGGTHPTGEKVSNPLAVDQGNPFFLTASWTFLAVISIASAFSQPHMRSAEM